MVSGAQTSASRVAVDHMEIPLRARHSPHPGSRRQPSVRLSTIPSPCLLPGVGFCDLLALMSSTREPVPILHRDDHVLVVSKPAGILSVPTQGAAGLSLPEALERQGIRAWPVHRLDREVSGATLFALDEETRASLEEAFRERTVRKTYWALAQGRVRPPQGAFKFPILEQGSFARVSARGSRGAAWSPPPTRRRPVSRARFGGAPSAWPRGPAPKAASVRRRARSSSRATGRVRSRAARRGAGRSRDRSRRSTSCGRLR